MKSTVNNTIVLEIEIRETDLVLSERSQRTQHQPAYICSLDMVQFGQYRAENTVREVLRHYIQEAHLWNFLDEAEHENTETRLPE